MRIAMGKAVDFTFTWATPDDAELLADLEQAIGLLKQTLESSGRN